MKKSNALTEEKLKETIDSLIKKETITLEEKGIKLIWFMEWKILNVLSILNFFDIMLWSYVIMCVAKEFNNLLYTKNPMV